ncbi:hypothetical protein FJY63_02695 [Candidatus Sumerlaeota bacterium]|nr:hypothetical protein [Candidatus Sumerlaeota bacterium]
MSHKNNTDKREGPNKSAAGGTSYTCKSMSEWQSEADKVCAAGQEAAYRQSKAKEALENAKAELARALEIAAQVHASDSSETPNAFQTGELQPIAIIKLKIRNAELDFSDTKRDYEEAKGRLLDLLASAEGARAQAKAWSAPTTASRFADALTESTAYHEMEAEFLVSIVEQLRDAARSMEEQVSGRDIAHRRPPQSPRKDPREPSVGPRGNETKWPAPPYLLHPSFPAKEPRDGGKSQRDAPPHLQRDFVGPLPGRL